MRDFGDTNIGSGFPFFRDDKIPWLFPEYLFPFSIFLTENIIHFSK